MNTNLHFLYEQTAILKMDKKHRFPQMPPIHHNKFHRFVVDISPRSAVKTFTHTSTKRTQKLDDVGLVHETIHFLSCSIEKEREGRGESEHMCESPEHKVPLCLGMSSANKRPTVTWATWDCMIRWQQPSRRSQRMRKRERETSNERRNRTMKELREEEVERTM